MSNSSLASYTKLSPHKSSRNGHKIDTISIHCVVGQCGVEALGSVFQTKEASANYGIGYDGRIGLYVDEANRSWCTSSKANDERAITIECASDTTAPYAVNSKVYNALIDLLADVCKRNNIYPLKWSTNKNDRVNHKNGCNMTVHRDYANKSCPGDYLYSRHQAIADVVNKRIEDDMMVRYNSISEMPTWAKAEAQELIDMGALKGKGDNLDISEDMLRCMIICLRMSKALIATIPDASIDKDALFEEFKKNLKLTVEVE